MCAKVLVRVRRLELNGSPLCKMQKRPDDAGQFNAINHAADAIVVYQVSEIIPSGHTNATDCSSNNISSL